MAFLNVRVDYLVEFEHATEQLVAMRDRASDLTPAFAMGVDPYLTNELMEQFASEGAHFGDPWAPLAERTLQARKRPGHGRGGILRDTDAMYNAFINPFDDGAIRIIDPRSYQRGVSTPYYPFHHDGTLRMPARPVVPAEMPAVMQDSIYGVVRQFILTGEVVVPEVV